MTTPTGTLIFGGLIAWGIYRRIRRNIGRQPLRRGRIIFSLIFLAVVTVLLVAVLLPFHKSLLGMGGGILIGGGLGVLGLRLTRFETTAEGHFYVPNMIIGIFLSLLLVGRMLYRWYILENVADAGGHPQYFQSPLTFFIFGLVAGYYLVYRTGLFIHLHDKKPVTQ
jgi:hypothetical protein